MTFARLGWQVFAAEPVVQDWVASVRPTAIAALHNSPRRHGDTWAPGVDALENDAQGRVGQGPKLRGAAFDMAQSLFGALPLHKAQISGVYPGYPRQDLDETDANHRFRRNRDAAHLDGLLPLGPDRRRHLIEPHAWILGVALTQASDAAAPLVVYEGSQDLIHDALAPILGAHPPETWAQLDLTAPYHAARRAVFQTCARRLVPLTPGQTVLVHRLAIHGVAPWAKTASADPAGRLIAYFRPQLPQIGRWLDAP